MHSLFFNSNIPGLLILWFVFAMLFSLISMHCGLLEGEFNALFAILIKHPWLVDFVVCLCHAVFAYFNALWITRG